MDTTEKRVFVSDADGYSSRHVAEVLSSWAEASEDQETPASPGGRPAFQVVGTVSAGSRGGGSGFLLEQYATPSRAELLQHLLGCDAVVYNVSEAATRQQVDEAAWAATALHAEAENFKSPKIFILVSTVMTRAAAAPPHPGESGVLLSEEGFRRRRPHPSFRNRDRVERLVLKLGAGKKSKLSSYVVACGLQYGKGENLFHYFFKVSWLMQFPKVPVFGQGTNRIPMIHVCDLAGVIRSIIELRPASKYILAVDGSKNSLEEIVQTISDKLGPGKTEKLPEDAAVTMGAFQPEELECLRIDLCLDAFVIRDSLSLRWTSEAGMVENMDVIVEEYRDARQLHPVRICLVGPPAVGKTTVAKKLCSHYNIHHVDIKELIEQKISQLKGTLKGRDAERAGADATAAAQTQLEAVTGSMELNAGRLADHLVFDILREKLNSNPCRNQGFVLDGYPTTYEQANQIFRSEATESQDSRVRRPVCDERIAPEHVVALEASDDFLTKRVLELPEGVAEDLRFTQDAFAQRLSRYRRRTSAEETLLDYFDELEIHPEYIEVTTEDPEYTDVMRRITEMVGLPKNFGRSPEEQEAEDRKNDAESEQKRAAAAAEKKRRNEAALAEMAAQYEEWRKNLSEVTGQECELLEARSRPLRNYLMKYVMPSLTEAMSECSKIKPEDPVDFLAEHLLRNKRE